MGIRRSPETDGLCGWDAVRLWEAACAGEGSALDRLVAYNAEDVMNLEPLMRHVYQTGCDDIARFAPAVHPVRGRL
jgi:hypothetical protein